MGRWGMGHEPMVMVSANKRFVNLINKMGANVRGKEEILQLIRSAANEALAYSREIQCIGTSSLDNTVLVKRAREGEMKEFRRHGVYENVNMEE